MPLPLYVSSIFTGRSTPGASGAIDTTGATELRGVVVTTQSGLPTFSDSKGNTWTQDGSSVLLSSFPGYLFVFKNVGAPIVGAGHTFSSTGTSETSVGALAVAPGAGGTLVASVWNGAQDANSPYISADVTTTLADALLVAFGATNGLANPAVSDWSANSFTLRAQEPDQNTYWGGSFATRAVTSVGTYSASFTDNTTGGDNSVVGLFAFLELLAQVDIRGSFGPRRNDRRPGRGPYNTGRFRRPSMDVFGGQVEHQLASTAAAAGAASGVLDHGVPLAGAAQGQAAVSGALETGTLLGAVAQGQANATGALDHGVPLAGAAQGSVAAAGALEISPPPPDSLFASRRNRPGRGPYSKGRFFRPSVIAYISKVADLSGDAAAQATAAAALQLLVNLAGAGVGGATASAALAKAVQLAVAAAGAAGAAGQLAISVLLNGAATGGGSASGSLSTNGSVDLAGNAVGGGLATGNLQLTVRLAGTALGTANASGTLLGSVPLNGAAVAMATSTGQLALSIALSGAALAQATASASFAGVVTLGGSAAAQAGVSGSLFLTVPLSAAAQALAAASGGLVVTVLLGGSASASSSATAALQKAVLLSGAAGGQANATGTMTVGGLSVSTERAYRARCVPRRWTARAASHGASA